MKLYAHYGHRDPGVELDINWKATPFNRVALMNHLAKHLGEECRYLEIGCDRDDLFASLPIADKTGVDPQSGGNCRMTSDAFFAENTKMFDLVFLDGLHTYDQLHRDVQNALKCTRSGGFIGIHDLVPRNWKEEHVPRLNGDWTGNVWKVGLELAASEGINFRLFLIDHGVGLIHVDEQCSRKLADLSHELEECRFADFHAQFDTLPKLEWQAGLDWVAECLKR